MYIIVLLKRLYLVNTFSFLRTSVTRRRTPGQTRRLKQRMVHYTIYRSVMCLRMLYSSCVTWNVRIPARTWLLNLVFHPSFGNAFDYFLNRSKLSWSFFSNAKTTFGMLAAWRNTSFWGIYVVHTRSMYIQMSDKKYVSYHHVFFLNYYFAHLHICHRLRTILLYIK